MADLPKTAEEAMQWLTIAELRPFDKLDYQAFAGVESNNPLIGEFGQEGTGGVIVVDGAVVEFIDVDFDGEGHYVNFVLTPNVTAPTFAGKL
jgi:hypothetical protein